MLSIPKTRTSPVLENEIANDVEGIQPPSLMVPMGPVQAAQMGAATHRRDPGLLARLFKYTPSVRTVLLGSTILASGIMAGPAIAQIVEPEVRDQNTIEINIFESEALRVPQLVDVLRGASPLFLGAEGDGVEAVQAALMRLGIEVRGGADGDFGGGTERAIEEYQTRRGLAFGSGIDAALIRRLDADLIVADRIQTPRFRSTSAFLRIATGDTTLERGTDDKKSTEILQATLYALGEELGASFIDADFGDATVTALISFQTKAGLPPNGILDQATLEALDGAAATQVDALASAMAEAGSKHQQFRIVGDLVRNRIYVVDIETEEPIARYLTSPGKPGHRTRGDEFTVRRTMVRKTWYPTPSMNARPVGPGLKNPMGLVKFDLGRYYQYIHGTPFSVRDRLGSPASRGCLRMSTENILEMADYIEPGTKVAINRDEAESDRLWADAADAGIVDRQLDAGRDRLGAYLTGELGVDESMKDGVVVRH